MTQKPETLEQILQVCINLLWKRVDLISEQLKQLEKRLKKLEEIYVLDEEELEA